MLTFRCAIGQCKLAVGRRLPLGGKTPEDAFTFHRFSRRYVSGRYSAYQLQVTGAVRGKISSLAGPVEGRGLAASGSACQKPVFTFAGQVLVSAASPFFMQDQVVYDVAVIGGGPAGSTAAALLAKHGRKVVVLEREKFPRFHIGESLLPYSMSAFERLGVREKLDAMAVAKFGGEVATACGSRRLKFFFKNGFRLSHHRAYQVLRSDFDKLLLDNARDCGAEVREETAVENLAFDASGVICSVRARIGTADAGKQSIRARYLVDCSGRNAVVGSQFKLKRSYPTLRKFSVYAHFEKVHADDEEDVHLTRLVRGDDHWCWLINVSETRTSVGVVMDTSTFRSLRLSPEEALERYLQAGEIGRRMANAVRVSPIYSTGDYSYRNTSLVGERWLLAGDAAGFIDPIFSTGVFLAVLSGEQCADMLNQVLDAPAVRPALFGRYERRLNRVMDMYLRFVNGWYRQEFVEVFTNPTERLQLAPAINAVLAGNIGNSFAIWWRMQVFYLVLFLQRFFALCPRLPHSAKA